MRDYPFVFLSYKLFLRLLEVIGSFLLAFTPARCLVRVSYAAVGTLPIYRRPHFAIMFRGRSQSGDYRTLSSVRRF